MCDDLHLAEPTSIYGLVARNRKAAARSASELSQAITGLERHHEQERQAFAENAALLTQAINADPNAIFSDGRLYSWHNMRIEGIASEFRSDCHKLLQRLLALRSPLADILIEAQSLLPDSAMLYADVEPGALETPPKPITDIDLILPDRLRVLHDTLAWSQRVARSLAVHALGPCYALLVLIEHPSSEAMELHGKLDETQTELLSFILSRPQA
jgi:hypothetical protein